MSVRLICVSKPVVPGINTTGELLAFCARVSSTANQSNHSTGGKLLRSLMKRKEWSPFEMVSLTVEITTTRDIARQILRHRSFSFQEFSQRYAVVEEPPVFREARLQHPTDRQMSVELQREDYELEKGWLWRQEQLYAHAQNIYQEAIAQGIAKEVARAVLPEGMTVSKLYMAGNLRLWLHYIQLRAKQATQKEHRLLALEISDTVINQFPELEDVIRAIIIES